MRTPLPPHAPMAAPAILAVLLVWACCLPAAAQGPDPGADGAVSGAQAGAVRFEPPSVQCLADLSEDYQGMAMSYPTRLFMDGPRREIYVIDSGNGRILVYTYDFFPLLTIGPSDGLESPLGVAVDAAGWVYVAQGPGRRHGRARISVYNPALIWKRDLYFSGFDGAGTFVPKNIAVGPDGGLYVAGRDFKGLVVLDGQGGFLRLVRPEDALGEARPAPVTVCDVEVDAQGRLYLLSEEMGRVYVYDHRERPLFRFGLKGGSNGQAEPPTGPGRGPGRRAGLRHRLHAPHGQRLRP